jgi:hypothetical protein
MPASAAWCLLGESHRSSLLAKGRSSLMRPASKYELPDLAEAVRQINADLLPG